MNVQGAEREEELIRSRVRAVVRWKHYAYEKIWFNPGYIYRIQELERAILTALGRTGHTNLETLTALDIGCGRGDWTRQLINWGAQPQNLCGVDLVEERVDAARRLCAPGVRIDCGSALQLRHPDRSFDVVILFSVFCMILNDDVCRGIAREAMRVLKNDGVILWCDYRYQPPGEKDARAVNLRQLRQFFRGARITARPIHPLPPLLRRIGPYAPFMCGVVGLFPFARTHYFATIEHSARAKEVALSELEG